MKILQQTHLYYISMQDNKLYLNILFHRETVDRDGKARVAGEEWMVRRSGAYLPGVYEEIVSVVG